jgi:hypothetical protein
MAIRVTLACGCVVAWAEGDEPPVCRTHDERQVARVAAPPPRFTGTVLGPQAVRTEQTT